MQQNVISVKVTDQNVNIYVQENARSKRLSLKYHPITREFSLTKPPKARKEDILNFLNRSKAWLAEKMGEVNSNIPFTPGTLLPILGQEHLIQFAQDAKPSVVQKEGVLLVSGFDPIIVPGMVKDWLRGHIYAYIADTSKKFAKTLGKPVGVITIKDTKSRWASCSSHGNLAYSWRLAMAPEAVVEYICAHEVSHLVEMNHSPAFWGLVAQLCPSFNEHRSWLKIHGKNLFRYG